jgi:hypothetical protein
MSRHKFAPGAIEHHKRTLGTPAQRRELVRWLKLSGLCFACTGAVAFVAGLVNGWLS